METEALALLENDWSRTLAAAWPRVQADLRALQGFQTKNAWAEQSGVALELVEIYGVALWAAGICTPEGLDPVAQGTLRRITFERIAGAGKRSGPRD
jgi:hypothetical protein